MAELENLKARLANLGVQVKDTGHGARASTPGDKAKRGPSQAVGLGSINPHGKAAVSNLLDKINRVEAALNTAEALTSTAQNKVDNELARSAANSPAERRVVGTKKKIVGTRPKTARTPLQGAIVLTGGPPHLRVRATSATVVRRSVDIGKDRIPAHTPLASVLAQYRESETIWAQEKAQLRREADTQRRRANHFEEELKRLSRLSEHRSLDIKALKSALRNRDNQLVESGDKLKELDGALERYQEDAAVRMAALSTDRDDLKGLLVATLQRLEAVDDVVHRADVSSAIMQEKVKELEDERLHALEAAAIARAEVQELTESRRKLQWQSKLLEKMSEVQLKHNKHKTEAIKKLLADPPYSGAPAAAVDDDDNDHHGGSPDQARQARANHRSHVTFLEEMTRDRLRNV